jgi:cytochrome c-type biogenesis protein CcmH/NrfF
MSRTSGVEPKRVDVTRQKGRRFAAGSFLLAMALLAAGGALTLVALRGPAPPETMADQVRAVAASLRCPVCQNLSVADSPSRLAQEMRRTIARDLRAGKSAGEIRQAFATAYGPWILESPPKRGIDLVAWIAPVLLLLGGLLAAAWAVWHWSGRGLAGAAPAESVGPDPRLSAADRSLLDRALAGEPEEPS